MVVCTGCEVHASQSIPLPNARNAHDPSCQHQHRDAVTFCSGTVLPVQHCEEAFLPMAGLMHTVPVTGKRLLHQYKHGGVASDPP